MPRTRIENSKSLFRWRSDAALLRKAAAESNQESRQVFADADVGVVCMHLRIKWLPDDNFVVLHRYQQFIYLQIQQVVGGKPVLVKNMGIFGSKSTAWVPVNEKLMEKCEVADSQWAAKERFSLVLSPFHISHACARVRAYPSLLPQL